MIDKIRLGIPFIDATIGGAYRKRPILCCGRHGSGKTIFALHCLKQAVEEGEQALLLSSWNPRDLSIISEKVLDFSCDEAAEKGVATLLEYAGIMTSPVFEQDVTLPPDSFNELIQIIEEKAVTRVIIDTILPWVAIRQKDRLAKHVFSFIHAFDRMGVTAVFTLPKPVSPLAFSLKKLLEDQIPVAITLDVGNSGERTLTINKYLGESIMPPPIRFEIVSGAGMVTGKSTTITNNDASSTAAQQKAPAPASASPIRFASAFKNT